MKKQLSLFLISFVLFGNLDARDKDLPDRYKKWLEEEVVYIITPLEREVFFKLRTDRERDLFINAFWNHRDPTPGTPKNEFREEHYRRLSHATHYFGRSVPRPGWKTDRGRIFVILGEPTEIQSFEGKSAVFPTTVWFYQGKTDIGLPPGFNVVFFKEKGSGEYKLYSPLRHGPQALLTMFRGGPLDYKAAYDLLREIEPRLAEFSLSLIPGHRSQASGRPDLSSDMLIQRVESTPTRQAKQQYARKFIEYKDVVEVEYSANYISSYSLVKIAKDPSGSYFVHYALEPERLSVNSYEDKYYTSLKLNGTVSDMSGKTIYQIEKRIPFEFSKKQAKQLSRSSSVICDMFPLIPGNFKLSILLKNEASKEFTSLERDISIPVESDALQMTSILVGYKINEDLALSKRPRPFQVGSYQVYFEAKKIFLKQDNLTVIFQIHGLSQDLVEQGEIKYAFKKNGEEFHAFTKKLKDYQDTPNFVEIVPLANFLPAHYQLQVSLWLEGKEILSDREEFDLTHQGSLHRPWIYAKPLPQRDDPVYSYIRGAQLFHVGKREEAKAHLEKAHYQRPSSMDFSLGLARTYAALREYSKIKPLLYPLLSEIKPPRYEVYYMLGKAYQNTGEYDKAIDVFDKALSNYGVNTNLLNSLGSCFIKLGEVKNALEVWKKSLEINPDQPQILKNIEIFKKGLK